VRRETSGSPLRGAGSNFWKDLAIDSDTSISAARLPGGVGWGGQAAHVHMQVRTQGDMHVFDYGGVTQTVKGMYIDGEGRHRGASHQETEHFN
jgi:hypothetical protein